MTESDAVSEVSSRDRILKAAAKLMARSGIKGATTKAIALESGMNEVTIFRLFGTKRGLLDAMIDSLFPSVKESSPLFAIASREWRTQNELQKIVEDFGICFYEHILLGNADILDILFLAEPDLVRPEKNLMPRVRKLRGLLSTALSPDDPPTGEKAAGVFLSYLLGAFITREGKPLAPIRDGIALFARWIAAEFKEQ